MKSLVIELKTEQGIVAGGIYLEGAAISFEGEVKESARIFAEFLNNTYLADLVKANKAMEQDLLELLEECRRLNRRVSELQGDTFV